MRQIMRYELHQYYDGDKKWRGAWHVHVNGMRIGRWSWGTFWPVPEAERQPEDPGKVTMILMKFLIKVYYEWLEAKIPEGTEIIASGGGEELTYHPKETVATN